MRNNCLKKLLFTFIFLQGVTHSMLAQYNPDSTPFTFENYFKNQFDWENLNIDPQYYYNLLQTYHNNPIPLNGASANELEKLAFLNALHIHHFLQYRGQYGPLKSLYELLYIPHFDKNTIGLLLPFVKLNGKAAIRDSVGLWPKIKYDGDHTLLLRYQGQLEKQKGFSPFPEGQKASRYQGVPGKFLTRFKSSHREHYSLALTMENDAGEPMAWEPANNYYGIDFISGHIQVNNVWGFDKITAGDYQLQFGQGLIFGSGFMSGKSPSTIQGTRQHSTGIDPYTSTRELGFLRGMAASYNLGNFQLTGFYGNQKVDGITGQHPTLNHGYFPSLRTTGYHRTSREMQGRQQIKQKTEGVNIAFATGTNNLNAGMTFTRLKFDHYLLPGSTPYKKFDFQGSENDNTGIYWDYIWNDFHFFGEAARSKSGGMAGLGGLTAYLTSYLESAWIYRHYQTHYHSFFSAPFGENSSAQNEKGFYWGIKLMPLPHTRIAAYFDTFSFPWLKFRSDAPSRGYEYFIRLQYQPHEKMKAYFQIKSEEKSRNTSSYFRKTDSISYGVKRQYALDMDYETDKVLDLAPLAFNTRIQWAHFNSGEHTGKNPSEGFALIQDLQWKLTRFAFYARMGLFDTDHYDTRQYVYENDVLYAFSIPAYQDTGIRNYMMVKYEVSRKISIWIRLARYRYLYKDQVGSGLEAIQGNKKTTGKLQFRFKL